MSSDTDNPSSVPVTSRKRKRTKRVGKQAPSQTHGTQVRFHVKCGRCGADDILSFVPKTVGDMLCQACATELFGAGWRHGRPEESKYEHAFTCEQCGKEGRVPFKPDAERKLLCAACFRGEEPPRKDRLKRMRRVE